MKCPMRKTTTIQVVRTSASYQPHIAEEKTIEWEDFQDCIGEGCAWWVGDKKTGGVCVILGLWNG